MTDKQTPQVFKEEDGSFIQENYTHRALLIAVEPIVRDTAESLLREALASGDLQTQQHWRRWVDRARRLLERKEGE